jgi:hypothetical protein
MVALSFHPDEPNVILLGQSYFARDCFTWNEHMSPSDKCEQGTRTDRTELPVVGCELGSISLPADATKRESRAFDVKRC